MDPGGRRTSRPVGTTALDCSSGLCPRSSVPAVPTFPEKRRKGAIRSQDRLGYVSDSGRSAGHVGVILHNLCGISSLWLLAMFSSQCHLGLLKHLFLHWVQTQTESVVIPRAGRLRPW